MVGVQFPFAPLNVYPFRVLIPWVLGGVGRCSVDNVIGCGNFARGTVEEMDAVSMLVRLRLHNVWVIVHHLGPAAIMHRWCKCSSPYGMFWLLWSRRVIDDLLGVHCIR